ncbi:class I SAM-dependent methyltransferase [Mesorhizobium sp. 1B3]|uniref:class I SAM-dependent methyltransferase n=1 Tax=Mesorhizobium sp. 1B3 TaxID=3243599 RepID=UPI003D98215E
MKDLKARIVDLIGMEGPIPIADYMAICLYDPRQGYYTTHDPFGSGGDFITAPEVSQMFGELIGAWVVAAWRALDRPSPPILAEIGPGRGTLMKDMVRTILRIAPELHALADFRLVEVSPRLAEAQADTLRDMPGRFGWHSDIDELPGQPLFIVGNELFDAIPIRQYVRTADGWRERCVTVDNGNLVFVAGAGSLDESLLPPGAADAPHGAIAEIAPARSALMEKIARRLAGDGGAGLFIDYGHLTPAIGDSFQALSRHAYADPLAEPGKADLTTHVDFAALAASARGVGLHAQLATQGDFLLRMGLLERAGRLGAKADLAVRERISQAVERLAGPDQMGELFKIIAVSTRALPPFV